jgi:hypothetical protein
MNPTVIKSRQWETVTVVVNPPMQLCAGFGTPSLAFLQHKSNICLSEPRDLFLFTECLCHFQNEFAKKLTLLSEYNLYVKMYYILRSTTRRHTICLHSANYVPSAIRNRQIRIYLKAIRSIFIFVSTKHLNLQYGS